MYCLGETVRQNGRSRTRTESVNTAIAEHLVDGVFGTQHWDGIELHRLEEMSRRKGFAVMVTDQTKS